MSEAVRTRSFQQLEPIIEPGLRIVDAHHHLWEHAAPPGGPRDVHPLQAMTEILPRYLVDEFIADIACGHAVEGTVYVQSGRGFYCADTPTHFQPVGETAYVRQAAEAARERTRVDICAAIVGYADLTLGDAVQPVLEAHIAAGGGRFRGIRNGMAWDADQRVMGPFAGQAGLYASDSFRKGARRLAELGLSFDAWLLEPQLPELVQLARALPELTIILDHFGAPLGIGAYTGSQKDRFPLWRKQIDELAACENVVIKLGGLGMPLAGLGSFQRAVPLGSMELAQLWSPYFRAALDAFGPARCMFESNFPAEAGSASYRIIWNVFKIMAADLGIGEKAMLFEGTARRTYRLGAGSPHQTVTN
ncbi:amidohydrolase [Sphingomonas sp. DBB INV C78]|uniref:amidohydrolase family protein n=1 Tax=Sphingomonas sp. DBB INV C78 TaxID=3349434 RepID=UPI0036D43869